jgi:hypothetical protein
MPMNVCGSWTAFGHSGGHTGRRCQCVPIQHVVFHIERSDLPDLLEHPNPEPSASQRIFVAQCEDYVYPVPFVEDERSSS